MKVIYKYRLPFKEVATVDMPRAAHIIRIDGGGELNIWAIVDTEQPLVTRTFHLFKTGGIMPDNIDEYIYHGCGAIFIQMELMMYVFEEGKSYYHPPLATPQSQVDINDLWEK